MYAGSQFDGSAAFSGGGFMPSQTTQAPDPSFSPSKVIHPPLSLRAFIFPLIKLKSSSTSETTEEDHYNFLKFYLKEILKFGHVFLLLSHWFLVGG